MLEVARVYAQSLLDIINEGDLADGVATSIERFAEFLHTESDLRLVLFNPCYRLERRLAILRPILAKLGVDDLTGRFLTVLLRRRRLDVLPDIHTLFCDMADRKFSRTRATVETASPLDQRQRDRLREQLSRILSAEVRLDLRERPDLLAGFVATARHRVFDASLKTQLETVTRSLAAPFDGVAGAGSDSGPKETG